MSFFRLGLSSPFALDRFFRRDSGVDAGIIEIRIVIPPTVVILFRDLAGLQFSGLFLPGTEPLLKISGFGAAIENFGTKADQTIPFQNKNSPKRHSTTTALLRWFSGAWGRNPQQAFANCLTFALLAGLTLYLTSGSSPSTIIR